MDVDGQRKLHAPETFWTMARKIMGRLKQPQVDSANAILDRAKYHGIGWVAYELATAWHEAKMVPQREWGRGIGKPYGKKDHTGQRPYGRGLVQLTWADNYARMDRVLMLNGALIQDYDLALTTDLSAEILVVGMEKGLFTGKGLKDFIDPNWPVFDEFRSARKIVNGMDKADKIATYAQEFLFALRVGDWR